jgi:hypothetical protein
MTWQRSLVAGDGARSVGAGATAPGPRLAASAADGQWLAPWRSRVLGSSLDLRLGLSQARPPLTPLGKGRRLGSRLCCRRSVPDGSSWSSHHATATPSTRRRPRSSTCRLAPLFSGRRNLRACQGLERMEVRRRDQVFGVQEVTVRRTSPWCGQDMLLESLNFGRPGIHITNLFHVRRAEWAAKYSAQNRI